MKVIWTPEAEQDRIDVWDYIAAENPHAAVQLDELFSDAVARLVEHPKLGKPGTISGTRELIPHESYRLVYELAPEAIWILALVSTSRLWPKIKPPDTECPMCGGTGGWPGVNGWVLCRPCNGAGFTQAAMKKP